MFARRRGGAEAQRACREPLPFRDRKTLPILAAKMTAADAAGRSDDRTPSASSRAPNASRESNARLSYTNPRRATVADAQDRPHKATDRKHDTQIVRTLPDTLRSARNA